MPKESASYPNGNGENLPQLPVEVTPIRRENFQFAVDMTQQAIDTFLNERTDLPEPFLQENDDVLQHDWTWIAMGPIRAKASVSTQLMTDNDDEFLLKISSYLIESVVFERTETEDFDAGVEAAEDTEKWDHLWMRRIWNVQELREDDLMQDEFSHSIRDGLLRAFEDKADADIILVQHRKNLAKNN